jgi:mannan endo-1,4-beta-mannosidase
MVAGFGRRVGSPTVIAFMLIIFSTAGLAAELVKTSGTTFTLAGRPFFITGVNNHYLPHASETEITQVLDDAVALGTPVLRSYLEPVIGSPDGSVPTIWDWQSTANSNDRGVKRRYLLYWDDKAKKM